MFRRLALVLALSLASPWQAAASDLEDFNTAVAAAYSHYRGAVFYLRTGNAAVAAIELGDAAASWREGVSPFVESPPDAFASDPSFGKTLTAVAERLGQAEELAVAGDLPAAAEVLAPVRGELAALREQNNVVVFSDFVDEANAAMDRLWVFRNAPPDWGDQGAVDRLKAEIAVTAYLYRRCREKAPATVRGSPEFKRIVDGAINSLDQLLEVTRQGEEEAVINFLREIRSFDRMLWLHFG